MDYKSLTLTNGIRVITIPMPTLESAAVTVFIGVGSRFEPVKIAGISHFIEHMAFKGSKKYKTAREVSETIDAMGADYNAATSKDWTNFFIKSRAHNLEKSFAVLADMILDPLLDSTEIEKERGVILEEIAMQEDTPMDKIGDIFMELVFEGNPLATDIAGTKKSVKNIKRDDFVSFRKSHYYGGNIVITVAGGVKSFEVEKLATQYFGNVASGIQEVPLLFSAIQDKPKLKVEYKKSEQAHFILGFLGHHRNHPNRYAENVLATILGRGMSSRLFHEIREKRGLAYSVGSSITRFSDTGVFETYAGVDVKRIDEAISVMLEEHYKLANQESRIENQELTKAKEYMKGRIALALEDTVSVCDYFGQRSLFMDAIETPEEIFDKIDAVTIDEIYQSASELFKPEHVNLSVIGPYKDEERFGKLLR